MVREPPSIADREWDAVVIGAGPAGSTTARILASHGHAVLLVDKHEFPRDKVCGDALIPDALNSLRRGGLYEHVRKQGFETATLSVYSPSQIRVDIASEFVTIRREVLDNLLVREAERQGATFHVGQAAAVARNGDDGVLVRIARSEQRIHAKIAVIATGADTSLLRCLGMVHRRQPSAVALRCYVRSPIAIDQLIISFDRSILPGYGWIFPLGDQEFNVGCGRFYKGPRPRGANLRDALDAFARGFRLARELITTGEMMTPVRGAMLRCSLQGATASDGGCILAIGETIGTTFDLSGEGIGKAMETGELAAREIERALVDNSPERLRAFPSILKRELAPRYVGYRVAANWLSRGWLNDFVAARVRKNRRLQELMTGILQETMDPRALLSWRLLLPRWVPWKPTAN